VLSATTVTTPAPAAAKTPSGEELVIGALNWQMALKAINECTNKPSITGQPNTADQQSTQLAFQSQQAKNNHEMLKVLEQRFAKWAEDIMHISEGKTCGRFVRALLYAGMDHMVWKRNAVQDCRRSDLTGRIVMPQSALACMVLPTQLPNVDILDRKQSGMQLFVFEEDATGVNRHFVRCLHLLNVFLLFMSATVREAMKQLVTSMAAAGAVITPDKLVAAYNTRYYEKDSRDFLDSYHVIDRLHAQLTRIFGH
jgi:hypothetical protein